MNLCIKQTDEAPTPWHTDSYFIYDGCNNMIADCSGVQPTQTYPQIAERIIHCVNQHENLVRALELCWRILGGLDDGEYATDFAYGKATAALAAAKGEK